MRRVPANTDAPCVAGTPTRRAVLKGAVGAAVGVVNVTLHVTGLAQDDPAGRRPQTGDLLVRASDAAMAPLGLDDVAAGAPTVAWAMDPTSRAIRNGSRFNQVLLVKLDPAALAADTKARAVNGIVAYSIICPHSGCDVAEWMAAEQQLLCACHSSVFDPKDGARVVDGPAPRNLPALPLGASDGRLVVAGGFTDRVGFEAA